MASQAYPSIRAGKIRRSVEWVHPQVELASGRMVRTALWRYPRVRFEIAYEVVDETTAMTLEGFYAGVRGHLDSFLFQDWYRPSPRGEVLGIGDGTRRVFKIWGDAFDGLTVFVNNATAAVSAYSSTTGYVMVATPPPAGALVTANVMNERYRVVFATEPFTVEYLGGEAKRVVVTLLQDKAQLDDQTIPWTVGTPPPG